MGSSEASTRRRVKLYMLNDERQWDDKGTGHVSAVCTEQDTMALVVISETDGSYLLESKIQPDTAYQKQQETLIVWSEGENMDLALSFQEKVGCDDVWEKICAVQGKDPSVEITQEVVDESDDADDTDGYTPIIIQSIQPLVLPPCEFSHLEETAELISQAVASLQKRERLVVLLESTNYLSQLMDLFHKAEDLKEMEALNHLYEIMRQFILINKHSVYETLFADDMLMDVIGMLEYNPSGRTRHRDFLRNKARFKEVLPLHNTELVSKIHQTYRVQYIQECCMPPPCLFDEHTLSQLKSFVSMNKLEIIRALQDDEEFMCRLFARLKSPDTDPINRKELSLFAKEFCNISIQTDQKEHFLNCLFQHGALRTAEVLLVIDDRDIKSASLEILQAFVENQPSVVRGYVYRETAPFRKDDELLINVMISQLLADADPELSDAFLLGYMLRILIDPDNMNNPGVRGEKTEFLSFFYKRCINTLVRPLFDNTGRDMLAKDDYHTALVLNHILELLTFCIETHTYHMKNYCFNRDLLKRVLVLLQSSHKFLVLAALRLLRRVIHMKEEFYNRYLIKNDLFKPVIKLFMNNGHRYNLLDSAIIELFDYIRSEEITSLITHTVENFWDILKGINYVQTFNDLKRAYDHNHRPTRPALVGAVGQQTTLDALSLVSVATSRFQRDPRALEIEEEQWFDQDDEDDDEEEENHLFPPQSATLVNGTSSAGTLSVDSIHEGLSPISHFDTHPIVTASTTSELLSLTGSQSIFTPLASDTVALNPTDSRDSSVFPTLSLAHSAVPSNAHLYKNGDQNDSALLPSNRSLSLSDRVRGRQTEAHVDTLSHRSHLPRQAAPIAIHIKSTIVSSPCESDFGEQSMPISTGSKDISRSHGENPQISVAVQWEDSKRPTSFIPSDVSQFPTSPPLHSKRSGPVDELSLKMAKYAKKSRHCSLSPEHSDISAQDPSLCLNSTDSNVVSVDSTELNGQKRATENEDGSSSVGLVDYSDEESDDGGEEDVSDGCSAGGAIALNMSTVAESKVNTASDHGSRELASSPVSAEFV